MTDAHTSPPAGPESVESLCHQLRALSDQAAHTIDADRLCRAADVIERLSAAQTIPDLYVPGVWRCTKCQFELMQSNLNGRDGTVTARDAPGEKCPNCNTALWRVSWKDWAIETGKRLDETWDELQTLKKATQPSPADTGDIDARMIAAGMIPLSEMLNSHGPMEKWMRHAHVNTLPEFIEWVSMKQREYMTMRMRYELGDKDKNDGLYEWVFAHAAVFDGIATQLRAIAGDET